MSRWLWALVGGVVLLAIATATVFWTAGNRTDVTSPVSLGPAPVAPAPVPPAPPVPAPVAQKSAPSSAPAPAAQEATPSPPPSPPPPAAQEAAAPPAPAPTPPRPVPESGQQAASPPAGTPSAPPIVAQELPRPPPPPAPSAEASPPPPTPERETSEVQGEYALKSLAQLVGAWAYSLEDCDRLFQRRGGGWAFRQPVDKFAQAAIVESAKKILLPSATCKVERASEAEGALKVSAECADSISYTSRSTVITLRSPSELIYSASGDPVLATTLKKCTP
jgi:hypothetical protein